MLDESDFTHPDEVRLDDTSIETPERKSIAGPAPGGQQQRQGMQRNQSMPQLRAPNVQPPAPIQPVHPPQRLQGPQRPPNNGAQAPPQRIPPQQMNNQARPMNGIPPQPLPHQPEANGPKSNPSSATATESNGTHQQPPTDLPAPRMPPPGNPEGFVTGRHAELLNNPAGARASNQAAAAFNPHAEATSIRRTHGVNPGKSAPIMKSAIQQQGVQQQPTAPHQAQGHHPPQQQFQPAQRPQSPALPNNGLNGATTPIRTNFVNPAADANRRIGMPPMGPVQNRGNYKPPSAVGPGPHVGAAGVKRPPLSDVSNIQQADGAGETKKTKLDHPAESGEAPPVDGAGAGVTAQ
jgi:DNA repair and recombination protein RAD52